MQDLRAFGTRTKWHPCPIRLTACGHTIRRLSSDAVPRLSPESRQTIPALDAQELQHIERATYHSVHPVRPHLDPAQRSLATLVIDATLTTAIELVADAVGGFVMVEEGAGRDLHDIRQVFKRIIAEERRCWCSFRSPLHRNRVSVHADPKHKCCLSLFA